MFGLHQNMEPEDTRAVRDHGIVGGQRPSAQAGPPGLALEREGDRLQAEHDSVMKLPCVTAVAQGYRFLGAKKLQGGLVVNKTRPWGSPEI